MPLSFLEMKEFGLETKTSDKDELNIETLFQSLPLKLKRYYQDNFKNKFYIETFVDSLSSD
jgi:hypothetical protein